MTPLNRIRIATRRSPLALAQTSQVKHALEQAHPQLVIEIIPILTTGDQRLDASLALIGGKGLFVKELEQALLDDRADIAVHSIKDLPVNLPDALTLTAVCERADPRDVLIAKPGILHWDQLPVNATIGTSSSRRTCQLMALRPDCQAIPLRGNIDTRLKKWAHGEYDALILAAAGLQRLTLNACISAYLDPETWIPAVGQGAIGIECRTDQAELRALVAALDHQPSHHCILAERSMNRALGGSCQLPIAGFATIEENTQQMKLRGLVANVNPLRIIQAEAVGDSQFAETLGKQVANALLAQGANLT